MAREMVGHPSLSLYSNIRSKTWHGRMGPGLTEQSSTVLSLKPIAKLNLRFTQLLMSRKDALCNDKNLSIISPMHFRILTLDAMWDVRDGHHQPEVCAQSRPMRGQYPGHVITLHQSESSISQRSVRGAVTLMRQAVTRRNSASNEVSKSRQL